MRIVGHSGASADSQLVQIARELTEPHWYLTGNYTLSVTCAGGGSGTVTSITCGTGATCSPTTITTTGTISASGGSSAFSSATVTVTSAQLKALNTTSVQLVAGVAGHYFSPIQATAEYVFGTTAYTVVGTTIGNIGIGASGVEVLLSQFQYPGLVDQTSSQVATIPIQTAGSVGINAVSNVTGLGIYLETTGLGHLTLGDGTLKITVIYQDTTLLTSRR